MQQQAEVIIVGAVAQVGTPMTIPQYAAACLVVATGHQHLPMAELDAVDIYSVLTEHSGFKRSCVHVLLEVSGERLEICFASGEG